MTHRRNCLCCATSCRYFKDKFWEESFDGWSDDHSGWEMGDPEADDGLGLHTTTGGSITCLAEAPDGETDFYIYATFGATSLSAVLSFTVGSVTVKFSSTDSVWAYWPLRLIQIYDGGELVREHNMDGFGSDTDSYGICFSGGKVIVSGVVSWDITPPTDTQVTVTAEVSGGEVRLASFELYRHKSEDHPQCPDCIPRNPCSLVAGQNTPRCLGMYLEPGAPKASHDAKWCACTNDKYIRRFWGSGYTCTWFERPPGGGIGQYYEHSRFAVRTYDVDGTTHYKLVWEVGYWEILYERDLGPNQPTEADLYQPLTFVHIHPEQEGKWWPSGKHLIFPENVNCSPPATVQFFPLGDGELSCTDDNAESIGTLARFCPCNPAGIAGFTASLQGFQDAITYKCPDSSDGDYNYHAEYRTNLKYVNGSIFVPDQSHFTRGVTFFTNLQYVNDPYYVREIHCATGDIWEHYAGWWSLTVNLASRGRGDGDNESAEYYWVANVGAGPAYGWWYNLPRYISAPIAADWDACSAGTYSLHFDPTCGYDETWSGTITLTVVQR